MASIETIGMKTKESVSSISSTVIVDLAIGYGCTAGVVDCSPITTNATVSKTTSITSLVVSQDTTSEV
jgi:hypothetical protein